MNGVGNGKYNAAVSECAEGTLWGGITSTALLCVLLVPLDVSRVAIHVKGLPIPHGVMMTLVTAQLEMRLLLGLKISSMQCLKPFLIVGGSMHGYIIVQPSIILGYWAFPGPNLCEAFVAPFTKTLRRRDLICLPRGVVHVG